MTGPTGDGPGLSCGTDGAGAKGGSAGLTDGPAPDRRTDDKWNRWSGRERWIGVPDKWNRWSGREKVESITDQMEQMERAKRWIGVTT
jgi:hypothetical protein